MCDECERLVDSGVVVVAAAGNDGYQHSCRRRPAVRRATRALSITDPGNADGVITVGSTHAIRAHTYGVSYFSSRGPTGDGRLKPDLVAPGERIQATVLERGLGRTRRHEHGRAARQRRRRDADGALSGAHRQAATGSSRSCARRPPTSAASATSRGTACSTSSVPCKVNAIRIHDGQNHGRQRFHSRGPSGEVRRLLCCCTTAPPTTRARADRRRPSGVYKPFLKPRLRGAARANAACPPTSRCRSTCAWSATSTTTTSSDCST